MRRPDQDRPTCVARVSATSAVTCDDGKTVVLWTGIDSSGNGSKRKFKKDHKKKVAYVSVSTAANKVFAASWDGDVTVKNLLDPDAENLLTFTKHYADGTDEDKKPQVWVVVPSSTGSHALSGANNGEIKYWDATSGEVLATFKDGNERIAGLAFRPAGAPPNTTQFLSAHEDGKALMWQFPNTNPANWSIVRTFPHGFSDEPVNTVAVDKDGKFAVSAGFDRTARVWDLSQPNGADPIAVVEDVHEDLIWRVAISPSGDTFAVASQDGTVRLFNLMTGEQFADPDGDPVYAEEKWGAMGVDFLRDNRIIYTTATSTAKHFKIWNILEVFP
jgi:WD40 repeat protein